MRAINRVIIHCSATKGDVSAATIRKWHTEDRRWRDIGYHDVIRTNGNIEKGRPIEQAGAHVQGHNADSIGICLAGGRDGTPSYTPEQWASLELLVRGYVAKYGCTVHGHNDFTNAKTCPNFDAGAWYDAL